MFRYRGGHVNVTFDAIDPVGKNRPHTKLQGALHWAPEVYRDVA